MKEFINSTESERIVNLRATARYRSQVEADVYPGYIQVRQHSHI
nr:hypothetical protein [Candidatus Sigynarchaeum springense]